jgi:carboxylesterase type B
MTQIAVPNHPPNPDVVEDEFQCLNFNVVKPAGSNLKGLPVMVWIHGKVLHPRTRTF